MNPDGTVEMHLLPTFQRWDGVWQPLSALNRSTGNWPYSLTDGPSSMSVARLGATFNQAKVPGATYEFRPEMIKETIAIPTAPPSVISVAVGTTGLDVSIANNTVLLGIPGGPGMWAAGGFHAWDSSPIPQTWPNAVSSLAYSNGILNVTLNADMLAHAVYPLYVDPTWTLSSSLGWGAAAFQDAVVDQGDHNIKIGWLADNFNDNANEIWTIDAGAVTFTGGVMNVPAGSSVHAGSSWYNQRFAFTVNFVSLGSAGFAFRRVDVNNKYQLVVAGSTGSVSLEKWIGGVGTTLGSFTTTITAGTTYSVKVVALGNYFEVWWQGVRRLGVTDPSPPSPISGYVQVWTAATLPQIKVDDVRVWNTTSGTITSAVRDAGFVNRPLLERITYLGGAFEWADSQINDSSDNIAWTDAHYVKVGPKSALDYAVAEGDQNRFYKVKVELRSTDDGTPSLSEITTTEGTPTTPAPSVVLGYERWQYYVGGLVQVVNGDLFRSEKEFGLRGKGFPIEFRRSYNSLQTYSGTLGLGWTHNYNVSLSGATDITMYDGDGSRFVYTSLGSNLYSSPAGLSASKLVKNGDATYSLFWSDGNRWNFTSAGRLALITDRNGNKLTLTYDGSNRLQKIADDAGQYLELLYDGNSRITTVRDETLRAWTYQYTSNRLTSVTDPLSNSTLYIYDASNRIEKVVDRANKMTRVVYDASNRVTDLFLGLYNRTTSSITWQYRWYTISGYANTRTRTVTDSNNVASTFTLDERGTPKNVTGPLAGSPGACCGRPGSESVASLWDAERNKVVATDAKGYVWRYTYDFRGNEKSRLDPMGNTSSSSWDNRDTGTLFVSLLTQSINFRGYPTNYTYDAKGNLITIATFYGATSPRTYDTAGFLKTSQDFRHYQTNYTVDTHGWLTQVKNPLGFVTTNGYDSLGRQVNVTTPLGFRTQYVYDALDRRTKVTDPMGNSASTVYNERGDVVKVIDPMGCVTQFQVNITLGAKSKTIEAGGNSTVFAYDTRGNLVTVTDPRLFTTTYQYDAYSRRTNETGPGGNFTRFTYDRNGDVLTRIDANNNLTTYAYDKLNRVTKATYPGSVVVTTGYDANGNVVQVVGFGYTRTETWDARDRATSTVDNYGSFSKTFGYWYDPDSHRTRITYSDLSYATYFYNAAGWQTYENHSDGQSWSFGYDNDGRRTIENYPNGVVTATLYDKASRITNIWTNKSGSVLESFAYTFDKAGNRKMMTEANGSWAKYAYDNLYRLLNESYSNGRSIGYTYDADGNRITSREVKVPPSLVVTTFTYGKDDQLLKAVVTGGATTTYAYDKNGNTKTRVSGSATTYAYDIENRLTSATTSSGTTSYAYSADGRRLKRVSSGTVAYLGNDPVSPNGYDDTIEEYTSTGTKTATYVHGVRVDELLGYKTTGWYSYHSDALGSVTRLTDSAGSVSSTYRYDAFGGIRAQSGPSNTYEFASREGESSTGLYYNRARYYDPDGARFIQKDPAGMCGGVNMYRYANDNPSNRIDPSGRVSLPLYCGSAGDWLFNFQGTCDQDVSQLYWLGGEARDAVLFTLTLLTGMTIGEIAAAFAACATVVGCIIPLILIVGTLVTACAHINDLCLAYQWGNPVPDYEYPVRAGRYVYAL
jgi:RHS repeat-associated protein